MVPVQIHYKGQQIWTKAHKAVLTVASEHDRNQMEVPVDEKDAMYVFDRGYTKRHYKIKF